MTDVGSVSAMQTTPNPGRPVSRHVKMANIFLHYTLPILKSRHVTVW